MKNILQKGLVLALAILLTCTVSLPVFAEALDKPPVPPKSTASNKAETEEKKKMDPLTITEKDLTALYQATSGQFLLRPIFQEQPDFSKFVAALNACKNSDIKKFKWDSTEAAKTIEGSFLMILKDGSRVIITLNQNNRMEIGDSYYQVTNEIYQSFLNIYKTDYKVPNYVQWLIFMVPGRVTAITMNTGVEELPNRFVTDDNLKDAIKLIRSIRVTKGGYYLPLKQFTAGGSATNIELVLSGKDGLGSYNLWIVGDKLYVQTTDLHFGCEYTLSAGEGQRIIKELKALRAQ